MFVLTRFTLATIVGMLMSLASQLASLWFLTGSLSTNLHLEWLVARSRWFVPHKVVLTLIL